MSTRHFLTLLDLTPEELSALISRARELKRIRQRGECYEPLKNRTLGMIFDKSSTRTRISFEVGMTEFGGHALFLSSRDTQLGRGEPIGDTARVMSRMVDGVMIRTFKHDTLENFAKESLVPVINGLTDLYHPCQLLADMQTYAELRGNIKGATVTWIGDGNNMCHSYINAARQFEFNLRISCPKGFDPDPLVFRNGAGRVTLLRDPVEAVRHAQLVVTDVWASMGQENEQARRAPAFADFQVTEALMAKADPDALFMHCLPAHRGEEVSSEVLEGTQSVVWEEAANRLHAQKALLEFLLT
jgi:ornithine carbamoyltransferase